MIRTENIRSHSKPTYKGYNYGTALEAGAAKKLDDMVASGKVVSWTRQHKIVMEKRDKYGKLTFRKAHNVDFLALLPDDSKLLIEAKGVEFPEFKYILGLIGTIYLPKNLDTEYRIWKDPYSHYRKLKARIAKH